MALSSSRPCIGQPATTPTVPSPPPLPPSSFLHKKKPKPKVFRALCSAFRSFPVITPITIKFPTLHLPIGLSGHHNHDRNVTGTFFGHRNGRVNFSMQDNLRSPPFFVLELPIHTIAFQKEIDKGTARISLECEKRPETHMRLEEEPLWTIFCNGKKGGFGVRRDATERDLSVMELLGDVSIGAGTLPGISEADGDGPDGELVYFRAQFERVVGSKDSVSLYMVSPEEEIRPELTIFLVRI